MVTPEDGEAEHVRLQEAFGGQGINGSWLFEYNEERPHQSPRTLTPTPVRGVIQHGKTTLDD